MIHFRQPDYKNGSIRDLRVPLNKCRTKYFLSAYHEYVQVVLSQYHQNIHTLRPITARLQPRRYFLLCESLR
jgi:hypothetical protein